MNRIKEVFINRDNMTDTEANETCNTMLKEMYDIIDNNGNYEDVEDVFLDYGLEMDYLLDLIL